LNPVSALETGFLHQNPVSKAETGLGQSNQHVSIPEDEVHRQAEVLQILGGAKGPLRRGADLESLAELVAGAEGHGEVVLPGHIVGAEVEQVAAFKVLGSRTAVARVVQPAELDQRIDLVQVGNVVVEVQVGIDEIAALVVESKHAAGR